MMTFLHDETRYWYLDINILMLNLLIIIYDDRFRILDILAYNKYKCSMTKLYERNINNRD